jgi:hypothetical protein
MWYQICSMVKFVEQNWTKKFFALFPYNPKTKFRLEVLFKKFHPRINRTTLFSHKLYLLNTIKLFLGHENRSFTKFQKPSQRGYPYEPEFQNSEYFILFLDTKILQKSAVSQNLYGGYP